MPVQKYAQKASNVPLGRRKQVFSFVPSQDTHEIRAAWACAGPVDGKGSPLPGFENFDKSL